MKLLVIGVSFRTCPEHLREKAAMVKHQIHETLIKLKSYSYIHETVLVSTCNRTEIFVITNNVDQAESVIRNTFMSMDWGLNQYLYTYLDTEALEHILRLALGLDSMILFEDQVLGQVKHAMMLAEKAGSIGKFLRKYFREAVSLSKELRSQYKFSEKPTSFSATAVKYVKSRYPDFKKKRILVIGSGEIGQLVLRHLVSEGFKNLTVTNRTYHPGDSYNVIPSELKVIEYQDRYKFLNHFDVVISATASAHMILKKDLVPTLDHNILMIDLALPRDIDREIRGLKNVCLVTLDDFKQIIDKGQEEKMEFLPIINEEIQKKVEEIENWITGTYYDPVLERVNTQKRICIEAALEAISGKLQMTEKQQKYMRKILKSQFNRLVQPFLVRLKEIDSAEDREIIDKSIKILGYE